MTVPSPLLIVCCAVAVATTACSESNDLLLGRVRAMVGTHPVEVTDCYQTTVPSPKRWGNEYRFTPCRDADIHIRGEMLTVNGRAYGHLNQTDAVLVDHSAVSIQRQPTQRVPSK